MKVKMTLPRKARNLVELENERKSKSKYSNKMLKLVKMLKYLLYRYIEDKIQDYN